MNALWLEREFGDLDPYRSNNGICTLRLSTGAEKDPAGLAQSIASLGALTLSDVAAGSKENV